MLLFLMRQTGSCLAEPVAGKLVNKTSILATLLDNRTCIFIRDVSKSLAAPRHLSSLREALKRGIDLVRSPTPLETVRESPCGLVFGPKHVDLIKRRWSTMRSWRVHMYMYQSRAPLQQATHMYAHICTYSQNATPIFGVFTHIRTAHTDLICCPWLAWLAVNTHKSLRMLCYDQIRQNKMCAIWRWLKIYCDLVLSVR